MSGGSHVFPDCLEVEDVYGGYVTVLEGSNSSVSWAKYQCHEGFKLQGNETVLCQVKTRGIERAPAPQCVGEYRNDLPKKSYSAMQIPSQGQAVA